MSKRTIHDFFKKNEPAPGKAVAANKKAKAVDPPSELLPPSDAPRPAADAAAAAAVSPSGSAAAAAALAGPSSAGDGDAAAGAAGGAGVADGAPAAVITDEQRLRAESNRAIALAKQHVKQAQDRAQEAALQGARPQLRELLVEPGWSEVLGREFEKPYFAKLQVSRGEVLFLLIAYEGDLYEEKETVRLRYEKRASVPRFVDKIICRVPRHGLAASKPLSNTLPNLISLYPLFISPLQPHLFCII